MPAHLLATLAVLAASTAPAFAHLDPVAHGSVLAGFSHPFFGLDHILAMVAVGLWAAMLGGRAVWLVPSAFVACMGLGFLLSLAGVPLPMVEPAIAASIVVLGSLIAAAAKLPLAPSMALVAFFALMHGHAHGAELGSAGALSFAIGFAGGTALLHGIGLGLGQGLGARGTFLARSLGGAAAAIGLVILAG